MGANRRRARARANENQQAVSDEVAPPQPVPSQPVQIPPAIQPPQPAQLPQAVQPPQQVQLPQPIVPPQPVQQAAVTSTTQQFVSLAGATEQLRIQTVANFGPPKRDDTGRKKEGRPVKLAVNHFLANLQLPDLAYQYDVAVFNDKSREVLKKDLLWSIVEKMKKEQEAKFRGYGPVFDGKKTMFSVKPFPVEKVSFQVEYADCDRKTSEVPRSVFKVNIQFSTRVHVSQPIKDYMRQGCSLDIPQDAIKVQQVVLRNAAANYDNIGRVLFPNKNERKVQDIGGGCELWFGHIQSLRLSKGPFLNLDVSQKVLVKEMRFTEYFKEVMYVSDLRRLHPSILESFGRKIYRKIKVRYLMGTSKGKTIVGLGKTPSQEFFEQNGRKTCVLNHIEAKLKKSLEFPQLPCLKVESGKQIICLPMELCVTVPSPVAARDLTPEQAKNMIYATAIPAHQRRKAIVDALRKLDLNNNPIVKTYGMQFRTDMTEVEGRVLPVPALQYGNQKRLNPKDGAWNLKDQRFLVGKALNSWAIIDLAQTPHQLREAFVRELRSIGANSGLVIPEPVFQESWTWELVERRAGSIKQKFPNLQLLWFIIPRSEDSIYQDIKYLFDIKYPIMTQCVTRLNVEKCNRTTISNLCLKLNAKLGGINNSVVNDLAMFRNKAVIVMGADVTHPAADQRKLGIPSIAAVIASVDETATQYRAEICLQDSKQEALVNLKEMSEALFRKYERATKKQPEHIIFYRDGVSEGQFKQVLVQELDLLRKAYMAVYPKRQPSITFLVVQKRHHTRLFPVERKDETGKAGNVPPGTVLDQTITHPTEIDFYLVSHFGIQGTSRPTHYHILWDDWKLPIDDLEKLTNQLCHVFPRCTRAVSNPAPSYCAHLAAFRGRLYFNKSPDDLTAENACEQANKLDHMYFI